MILDNYSLLSDDQDLSQTAGDYYSDVFNTLNDAGYFTSKDAPNGVSKDMAKGYPVELLCQITETFASGGAATLTVSLETATDEAFTSPVTLVTSKTFSLGELVEGTDLLPQYLPYGGLQWLRIKYTIATATTTAGTVTAGITTGHQSNV